jgi:ComF family protein
MKQISSLSPSRAWFKQALHRTEEWLLPYTCALCYRSSQTKLDLCQRCYERSEILLRPCYQCGRPLRSNHLGDRCHECLLFPPAFDRVITPFRYSSTIQALITQAKYQRKLASARILGELLAKNIAIEERGRVDLLVAAPAHYQRVGWRGYNQAFQIAREVSRETKIPLLIGGCRKMRATPRQAGLGARARQHNVAGVYRAELPQKGMSVAVIDDVMTTGATLNEIAQTLKEAGASHVEGWICARTT